MYLSNMNFNFWGKKERVKIGTKSRTMEPLTITIQVCSIGPSSKLKSGEMNQDT